ncbi:MAG: pyridoxamine 5'-phosphate oxidase family protein [Trebonia sp.]
MHPDGLEELPAAECLRLMATVPVGRIAYTRQAMPAVEPVNFTLDDGTVVFRTARGGKLAAATLRAVVAFQADDLDPVTRSGWSVTVVGLAQEVTEPAEVARLGRLDLETWAPGTRDHIIRITPEVVTGRRLHPAPRLTGPT